MSRRHTRTRRTREVFRDWRPPRLLGRMPPSALKRIWTDGEDDPRCCRCGRWPDQRTGRGGDWLLAPVRLCPACHERVEFLAVREGGAGVAGLHDGSFPARGRGRRRGRASPAHPPRVMRFADRARLGGAALRTVWRVMDRWDIGMEARRSLLGWRMAPGLQKAVRHAQAGRPVMLQETMLLRLGMVLGIHGMLGVLYLGEQQDLHWLRTRHRDGAFGGERPLVVMVQGEPRGLARVHRHLAALCAGAGTTPVMAVDADREPPGA